MTRNSVKGSLAYCAKWFAIACAVVASMTSSFAQQPPAASREYPPGSIRRVEDLPQSRFRSQIERLPAAQRDRAITALSNFHFTSLDLNTLQVDPEGSIYYADTFTVGAQPAAAEPVTGATLIPASPFPSSLIFHSKPGSQNILFINFSGENVSGTAWNTSLGRASIPALPFDTDGDATTFSDAEQSAIKRIWERMSEDYAPFDIDVTTERPATFTTRTAHALITRSTDANGAANPSSGGGGVAYINVFGSPSYPSYRPAWIYFDHLGNDASFIGDAASHEVGHNMGLSHDGLTSGTEYYSGHGSSNISWAPIMGASYYKNLSQWSKGEYYLANNTEDDLAIISGKLTYRADDHGDTIATATALQITNGAVLATTPDTDPTNTNTANKGILERSSDVDVFSFTTGSGPINLVVRPWLMASDTTRGGNLDASVELRDASGALILTNNPAADTVATIQTNLAAGVYYLFVRNSGTGDPLSSTPTGYTPYASLGQYFITGSVVSATSIIIPPGATAQLIDILVTGTATQFVTVTYTDNAGVNVSSIDSGDIRITGPNGYDTLARLVSVDINSSGTPRVARYAADPPNGVAWAESDNGAYTVWMQSNEVYDVEGAAVPSGPLGTFIVNVPRSIYFAAMETDPGWTLTPSWQYGKPGYAAGAGPTSGFTGTNIIAYNLSGNYQNNLALVYATTPPIDCSSLSSVTLRFHRWLKIKSSDTAIIQVSVDGNSWSNVWSTTAGVTDTAWQDIQYSLPAWVARKPSVQLRWGIGSNNSGNDIGWNIDDVEIFGTPWTNSPPIAATDVIDRWPTNGTKVAVATLLANDTDADGDAIRFVSCTNASANGGIVMLDNGWISYCPPAGFTNADSFTYTISDGRGTYVNGTVFVTLKVAGASLDLAVTDLGSGSYRIHLDGIPGRVYRLQYTTDLANGAWQDLASGTADDNGVFEFIDSGASSTRFYRAIYP